MSRLRVLFSRTDTCSQIKHQPSAVSSQLALSKRGADRSAAARYSIATRMRHSGSS